MRCYYWHLKRDMVVQFIATATSQLNAAKVPFHIKVLSDPNGYHRADAGVLYVHRRFGVQVGVIVGEIYEEVRQGLRPLVPLFAKRLADGLGLADDPGGNRSFGQQRCQLVAQATWDSFIQGELSREARTGGLIAAFLRDGLDPLRPHLGPGSEDDDSLMPMRNVTTTTATTARSSAIVVDGFQKTTSPARPSPLEVAIRMAELLCETAYWDQENEICNWMGRSSREASDFTGPIRATSAALSPDLYAGSAGIALFLGQIAAEARDPRFRRTSIGAIQRSIGQLDHSQMTLLGWPLSFYCGHVGVAFAASRIGIALGINTIDQKAESILDSLIKTTSSLQVLDFFGGSSGAIPALLGLGGAGGRVQFHDLAVTLGTEICRAAVRERGSCFWEPEGASGPGVGAAPLTGLSHGASGIGLALFELHAATGRLEFLETGRGAFAYEDSLFDTKEANWPDLRFSAAQNRFACTWCHGAPGIALTRLRAATLDPDRAVHYLETARIALATTIDAIEKDLAASRTDASLCHGLAGLGEVCLIASGSLYDPRYRDVADRVANALIDRHATSGDWPSGAPSGGPNPSFMLGLAGIGYWFLRLHDAEKVPSPLLLIP